MTNRPIAGGPDYHFIGIGGIGMSALAFILASQGERVSGSDLSENACTQRLVDAGVQIYRGHAAGNIVGSPQVVCSTAIKPGNPELDAARDRGLTICHRSEILAHLMNRRPSIGVSGTHGKTTTSSMLAHLLLRGGLDPTAVIGGEVSSLGGNARVGNGEYLVAEADESDGSLVNLKPTIGIITNIELDHTDRYQTLDGVVEVFQTFASQCGLVVGCLDCPTLSERIPVDISYSIADRPDADYHARNIRAVKGGTTADIWERGQRLGELRLQLLGHHNVCNALAAIAVARKLGVSFASIADAFADFGGARRRFELRGTVEGVEFIDDYAHHPSEIQVTLEAAKSQNRRVVAIFQPHRYSRIASLFEDFSRSFDSADEVVVVPTYSAGEPPLPHNQAKSAEALADRIRHHSGNPNVEYQPQLDALSDRLPNRLRPRDLVVFLGAGNLNRQIPSIVDAYRSHLQQSAAVVQ
ncbi:MAG: UDP-N-acetylmuramate--L-alanine ligase [Cyanobacteria bacterium J06597_1]